ncbi:hypothetical protein F4859DRAFT_468204 [Xylaria cf. heliscus]|nr:hypothetical protein F4859DRAFT_468204 [Xylaria cf. heliscus]
MEPDRATLAATPAGMPPQGMTSNLINPESRAWNVLLTIGITIGPAIILVVLRFYARLRLARSLGVDDYVCGLATASTLTFNGLVLSFLDKPGGGALGPHIWDVSVLKLLEYQWPAIVESVILRISNTLIKVSLLTFYLRIFNPVPRVKWLIWIGLAAVIAFGLAVLIGTFIICYPESGDNNNSDLPPTLPQRCNTEIPNWTTAGSIFSVVTDLYIFFIPVHLLPSLRLSRKRKAAVFGVFLIGSFACFAGVTNLTIRFVKYLPTNQNDFTYNVIDTYITKVAEINIGLICACMPVVSPVVVGPMRRFTTLFNSWFRGTEEEIRETRGYRDVPVTVGARSRGREGPTIPRGIITGRGLSGAGYPREESTTMTALSMQNDSRIPLSSISHGSDITSKSQSGTESTSEVEVHTR